MQILKYQDLKMADDFLNSLFTNIVLENNELLKDTFLDKLEIHKILIDKFKNIIPELDKMSLDLIKNSKLNIQTNDKVVMLFSIAALSVCILDEAKFLIEHDIVKTEYELEVKSILEELKLSGVGNGLVKNLSSIYTSIISLSIKIFKSTDIYDSLSKPNLLKSIDIYINKFKLSINDFPTNFSRLSEIIADIYINTGKLDDFKTKLSITNQTPRTPKHNSINEFNI